MPSRRDQVVYSFSEESIRTESREVVSSFYAFAEVSMKLHCMNVSVWNEFFNLYFRRNDSAVIDTEYLRFLPQMYSAGSNVVPSVQTFNTLLSEIGTRVGDFIVDELMPDHRVTPNPETFTHLLRTYCAKTNTLPSYTKASRTLLRGLADHSNVRWRHPMMVQYRKCLRGATVSDFNEIFEYLSSACSPSSDTLVSTVGLIFSKIMPYYSVAADNGTFMAMHVFISVRRATLKVKLTNQWWSLNDLRGTVNQSVGMCLV